MGKMSLTSCRALSTPGKFSNVDRYAGGQYLGVGVGYRKTKMFSGPLLIILRKDLLLDSPPLSVVTRWSVMDPAIAHWLLDSDHPPQCFKDVLAGVPHLKQVGQQMSIYYLSLKYLDVQVFITKCVSLEML